MSPSVQIPADAPTAQRSRLMGRTWIEPTSRRVRAYAGGTKIVDSKNALLVFEAGRPTGTYWIPEKDVRIDWMTEKPGNESSPIKRWSLKAGDRMIENAAREYANPDDDHEPLRDHLTFYWNEMDAWYEEDDEVFVEPRDPYHRVDVIHSSRHIKIVLGGETIAETRRPCLLFETLLPVRYYIPKQDVKMELLIPTATTTRCPYKGVASYWSVKVGDKVYDDIVWGYPTTIPECPKVENLVAFYNEKVEIYVDGEREHLPS